MSRKDSRGVVRAVNVAGQEKLRRSGELQLVALSPRLSVLSPCCPPKKRLEQFEFDLVIFLVELEGITSIFR